MIIPQSASGKRYSIRQSTNPIDTGISEGATLLVGGTEKPDGLNKGYYVKPTVFGDVTNDMTIAREEIFGPVLSIITYSDIDEAVSMQMILNMA